MKKHILIMASLLVILLLATLVCLSFCSEKQDVTTQTPPATSATIPSDPPATDKPSTDQPVTDKPVTDKPVTDAPVTDAPVTDEPATGEHTHTVVVDAAVPATCTQTGLTEGKHCSDCGEVLVKQTEIPAKRTPKASKRQKNPLAPKPA